MATTVAGGRPPARPDTAPSRPPEVTHGSGFRPDVQGMRAIAVGLVIVYHLNSSWLSGGYVGVDVFFAISGYLITGNLLRTYQRRGRVSLLDFYGRRARRLLPAVAVVLTVTWLASERILPATRLADTAGQIRASALYFENWTLAHNAVDYLKSSEAASPVQHFWSLSVEEQFYLIWPLLFVVAAVLARWLGRRIGAAVALGLAAVIVVESLRYSVHLTATNSAQSYFVTPTRIWELGLGGLLALLPAIAGRFVGRLWWLSWAGLAMVAASAVLLTGATPFPGWIAIFPVLGSVLMLGCGADPRGTSAFTARKPMVFIGDISYALYLWHWPLIVFFTTYTGHGIGLQWGLVIASVSILLAWLTKIVVEDPVRLAHFIADHRWRSLATALAVVVPVALVSAYLWQQPSSSKGKLDATHTGARVLAKASAHPTAPAPTVPKSAPTPPVTKAPTDYSIGFKHCLTDIPATKPVVCTYGDTKDPQETVAVVGDSNIAEWSTALNDIAKRHRWKLVLEVHSACPWTATTIVRAGQSVPYTACHDWGKSVLQDMLELKPDVLITSDRTDEGTLDHYAVNTQTRSQIGDGMATYWRQLTALGTHIVGVKETPEMHKDVPDCLSGRDGSVAKCSTSRASGVLSQTPVTFAVSQLGKDATLVDMNDLICGKKACRPIVGNVVVYEDEHHLTATYTKSVEPYLERRLLKVPGLER